MGELEESKILTYQEMSEYHNSGKVTLLQRIAKVSLLSLSWLMWGILVVSPLLFSGVVFYYGYTDMSGWSEVGIWVAIVFTGVLALPISLVLVTLLIDWLFPWTSRQVGWH